MTLNERADKCSDKFFDKTELFLSDIEEAYKQGATEQKEIDDKELSDALFIQRQMLIEKAVQHIMVTPAYAVQPEIYAEGVKQAMEGNI